MADEPLRPDLILAGREFLAKLDALHASVQGAGWVYFYNVREWRFHVVTPLVARLGRKRVYSMLADALDQVERPGELTIFDVHLAAPDDILFRNLQSVLQGEGQLVMSGVEINGIPVDAHFYRILPRFDQGPALEKREEAEFKRAVKKAATHAH